MTKSDEGVEMPDNETQTVDQAAEQAPPEVAAEVLVEEVSIDGMCGVY